MKTRTLVPVLAGSLLTLAAAFAQVDPPGRVARLNYATGQVSMLTQSTGDDWMPAQINYPMTSGDQIWTDFGGRADLQLGTASIRVREQTSATFTALDDITVQVQLVSGGINVHVRSLLPDEIFEIDTPNVAFTITKPGDYRIDVNANQTKVYVWSGAAEISGDNRTVPLRASDLAVVTGYDRLAYNLSAVPGQDEFDRWCFDRNRRAQQSQSAKYVSASMIGYEDLDDHGSWRQVGDYGMVWAPRVDAEWAPYKNGHWAWVDPWGWTWIDDAQWGFAPFHYGRWAYASDSWVWIPGPPAQRAVYSPALVAWAGGGPGGGGGGLRISASIGAGLAWFALGPKEVYVPSYRVSEAYVARVNVSNTTVNRTQITNVYNTTIVNKTVINNVTYVNQRAPNAVVGMSHADMASGRGGASVSVSASVAQSVQVSAVAPVPAQRPVMQQVRSGGAAPAIARPPAAVAQPSHQVMVRHQPPPATVARPVFTPAAGGAAPARPARSPGREADMARPAVAVPAQPRPTPSNPTPAERRPEPLARPAEQAPRPTPAERRPENPAQQQPRPTPSNPTPAERRPEPLARPAEQTPPPQRPTPVERRPENPAQQQPRPTPAERRPEPPARPAEQTPPPQRPTPAERRTEPPARPAPAEQERPRPVPHPENAPAAQRPEPPKRQDTKEEKKKPEKKEEKQ